MRRSRIAATAWALLAIAPAGAESAPVLRWAEVTVDLQTAAACVVVQTLRVEGAATVEHRLAHAEGTQARLLGVDGATIDGEPRRLGNTLALVLRPEAPDYIVRYAVDLPASRGARCPLWVPTVATDGQSRAVRIVVSIPAGTVAGGTLPAFTWTGTQGAALLGHLPAFVHVPIRPTGSPASTSVARLMDYVAIGTLVVATLGWAARRRRRAR